METTPLPEQTLSKIGEGAMARVYAAHHPDFGDIAVKLLRRNDPQSWQRLRREASAQSRLKHPNIGRIHGFGEVDGQPAILMQRIEGVPLDHIAADLPLEARIQLLVAVCDAVDHAHGSGLVHRDLKPANILVADDNGQLRPYVLDFGLVQDSEDGTLTQAGDLLGTPAYMSPEQARGDARHVDRRSDVYSLGCVLFQLLTGRTPFIGDSVSEILTRIGSEDAPLAHQISSNVPMALSRICAQCLERSPARRYPTAGALRDELQRWLQGQAPFARAVGMRYRVQRWLRSNPLSAWALASTAVVLIAALAWSLHTWRAAALRETQVADLTAASASVRNAMQLARLAPAQDLSGNVSALSKRLERLESEVESLGGHGARLAQRALGEAWLDLGRPVRAIDALSSAAEEAAPDPGTLRLLAEALLQHYDNLSAALAERTPEAVETMLGADVAALRERAQQALQQALDIDPETPPLARATLALLQGQFSDALALARSYQSRDPGDYKGIALQARITVEQSRMAAAAGDLDGAGPLAKTAQQLFDQAIVIGRGDGRLQEEACRAAADEIYLRGRAGVPPPASPGDQSTACDGAVRIRPDRPQGWSARALAWGAIAGVHAINGIAADEQQALLAMREDAQRAVDTAAEQPEPTLLLARAEIRLAQLRLGDFEQTLQRYDDAIQLLTELSKRHVDYVPLLQELGVAYRQRGRLKSNFEHATDNDYELAIDAMQRVLELRPGSVTAADELALTYVFAFYDARATDPSMAQALGQKAIAVIDEVLAREPEHPDMIATQIANLADLWAYLRSLEAGAPPPGIAGLRQRAHALGEQLRTIAPLRVDGYVAPIMLELTASDFGHDRKLSETDAIASAARLVEAADVAGVEMPEAVLAWLATERAREMLLTATSSPADGLAAARSLLVDALTQREDVDDRMMAQRTELELTVAEVHWQLGEHRSADNAIARGEAIYAELIATGLDLGDSHCDAGELLLISAGQRSGSARVSQAQAAADAFRRCIADSPFALAYRQADLAAAEALAAASQ